jgi:hypothetical protein
MTLDYGFGPEDVPPVPPPPKCHGGHVYARDKSKPNDRQWTCRACGRVAPQQPGTGTPGAGLGWPS